jgi:hypothetical protein
LDTIPRWQQDILDLMAADEIISPPLSPAAQRIADWQANGMPYTDRPVSLAPRRHRATLLFVALAPIAAFMAWQIGCAIGLFLGFLMIGVGR